MTEHVKKQIEDEAVKQYPEFSDTVQELDFTKGASWGYSLAEQEIETIQDEKQSLKILLDACKEANTKLSQEIERLKKENAVLKEYASLLNLVIYESPCDPDITFGQIAAHNKLKQFKTNNQL